MPHYLGKRDEPWLGVLLEEHARFAGSKRSSLRARLREPLRVRAPRTKLRLACHVLEHATRDRVKAEISPRHARWHAFRAAAAGALDRDAALACAARELDATSEAVEAALFGDLACERRVGALPGDLSPARLACAANQALVMGIVARALQVRFAVRGETRALIGRAHHSGLICNIEDLVAEAADTLVVEVSGPYALFRHTALYGRALAGLVPLAVACERYDIQARCALRAGGPVGNLVVRSGDPIDPGELHAVRQERATSRLEKELARAAPGWSLTPNAAPRRLGGSLCYPDYVLHREREPGRPYYVELVGFWTSAHVAGRLAQSRPQVTRTTCCASTARELAAAGTTRFRSIAAFTPTANASMFRRCFAI